MWKIDLCNAVPLDQLLLQVLMGNGEKYDCGSPNPFAGESGNDNLASTAYRYGQSVLVTARLCKGLGVLGTHGNLLEQFLMLMQRAGCFRGTWEPSQKTPNAYMKSWVF